jgi:dynactin complex subunit
LGTKTGVLRQLDSFQEKVIRQFSKIRQKRFIEKRMNELEFKGLEKFDFQNVKILKKKLLSLKSRYLIISVMPNFVPE